MGGIMSDLTIDDLFLKVKNSPFTRSKYSCDLSFADFFRNVFTFTHGDEDVNELLAHPERIFEAVPEFQRSNDQWSDDMKVSFIQNLLLGYKTSLLFYELNAEDGFPLRIECKVLDGLQRLTAIYDFITGRIKAWGFSYDELSQHRFIRKNLITIKFNCYSFENTAEAIEFYIAMNENITHSKADIDKARNYALSISETSK